MPVEARGKKIVEIATGKVVATASSERNAHIAAAIRNREHRKKQKRRGSS